MSDTPSPQDKPALLLFTGAGFSADAGAPVMSKFLEAAHTTLTGNRQAILDRIKPGFYFANYAMSPQEHSLETAYGAIIFREIVHTPVYRVSPGGNRRAEQGYTLGEVKDALERAIAILYGTALPWNQCDANPDDRIVAYSQLFRYLLDHYRLGIVTTNYDLVAEDALSRIGRAGSYWFGCGASYGDPVQILKLHGSVNWAQDSPPDLRSFPTTAGPVENAIFLPPTWNKYLKHSEFFADIWKHALHMIGMADILLVVGQRFPKTDLHLDYLFAEALAKGDGRPVCKRVTVADIDMRVACTVSSRFQRYQTVACTHPRGIPFNCLLGELVAGRISL